MKGPDQKVRQGIDDHFVPIEQVKQFEISLPQVRCITSGIYNRESDRCRALVVRAALLVYAAFFDLDAAEILKSHLSGALLTSDFSS